MKILSEKCIMIENKMQGGYATDMDEYAKSIIPIIEANYESYTETERHIADYFLNRARPERLSAELVAKELSVSPASLSRFAKKSGFHGYREFTYEFRVLSEPAAPMPLAISKWKLNTSLEANLNNRSIALRNIRERAKFKIQEGVVRGFRDFLYGQGFTEIHTPKIGAKGAWNWRTEFYT